MIHAPFAVLRLANRLPIEHKTELLINAHGGSTIFLEYCTSIREMTIVRFTCLKLLADERNKGMSGEQLQLTY